MEIPIPPSVPHPDKIYYKELLLKKEGSKSWTEYYAVLCDRYLIFNKKDSQNGLIIENNRTMLELQPRTTVAYARKTCYRFPFSIKIGKLNYQFKCETNLQRYRWVFSLRLAISGKSPEPPPKFIPTRYSRGKMAKKEDRISLRSSQRSQSVREQPARLNGHTNGLIVRSRSEERLSDSEEENELNFSSNAVRLQKNKESLMLTNKNAFTSEDDLRATAAGGGHSAFKVNDLEIVDIDDSGNQIENNNGFTRDRTLSVTSSESQTKRQQGMKKTVSIDESPTDMEEEHNNRMMHGTKNTTLETSKMTQMLSDNKISTSTQEDLTQVYRIYPDNMKSYSWTSLSIISKPATPRRENSAPPATQRNRRHARQINEAFFC